MKGNDIRGFTLVELLVVVSIISLLAALLFPTLTSSKQAALRTSCQSNLHQIGLAFTLYANDFDDQCPCAIDRHTRENPENIPPPHDDVSTMPDMVKVLLPYAGKNAGIFKCPSDVQPYMAHSGEVLVGTFPSYYDYAKSSYGFWPTDYWGRTLASMANDPKLRICRDQLHEWHSEYINPSIYTDTVNSLFGDGHVKFTPEAMLK